MPSTGSYADLIRQNWGFVSPEDQQRIAQARVLLAGCGLGSNIAVLAARTGFANFVLADGDAVELSNLNRQAFRREHIGRNKAEATAALVREINPDAQIVARPAFIRAEDASDFVRQCDLIVNLVDPGPALGALQKAAREQDKFTFFPLNVGFGGVLFTFSPTSPNIDELMGDSTNPALFIGILQKLFPALPPYLAAHAWIAGRVLQEGIAPPQLGIASSINAGLVVSAMVSVVLGLPLPVVPDIVAADSRTATALTWPGLR